MFFLFVLNHRETASQIAQPLANRESRIYCSQHQELYLRLNFKTGWPFPGADALSALRKFFQIY
jgi:hypothetical protein